MRAFGQVAGLQPMPDSHRASSLPQLAGLSRPLQGILKRDSMRLIWPLNCIVFFWLCIAAEASATGTDIVRGPGLAGAWVTQVTTQNPTKQLLLFRHEGETWSGSMTTRFGTMNLEAIVHDGERVAFSQVFDLGIGPVRPIRAYGELRGDELLLRMPVPTGGGFWERRARRASAE